MSNYHDLPALGSTDIKNLLKSDSGRNFLDGRQKEFKSSSMSFGTMCHCMLLEPDQFDERYAVYRGGKTRASADFKEFQAEHDGKEIVKTEEYEAAYELLKDLKDAPAILSAEKEFEVFGKTNGVEIKAKLDAVKIAGDQRTAICFDLKTGHDVIKRWEYSVKDYGYHLQQYHYRLCLSQLLGVTIDSIRFIFILAERSTGYVQLVELDEHTEQIASHQHAQAIEKYKAMCKRLERTQETVAQFPRQQVPAFDLSKITTRGLPEFVIARFQRGRDQNEQKL
jgi:uncharacterized protein YdbL (DUF1318 family)